MNKVGIVTVYNINNYGSILQAYALQKTIETFGFEPYCISHTKSKFERRLGRLLNTIRLGFRGLRYPKIIKKMFSFKRSMAIIGEKTSDNLKEKYKNFTNKHISIVLISGKALKKQAGKDTSFAFICGSDQMWRGAMVLINKNAFLRFAPKHKRISYAPSFGGAVESYNRRIFKKYINEIPYLSIRELQGAKEIKVLTGRDAVIALDPTLLVENEFWKERAILPKTEDEYILCYFLNEPSSLAINHISYLISKYNYKIKLIPYANELTKEHEMEVCEPNPFEFLGYFEKAKFICTDSFHGVAFSLSFNKDFYVYHREYTHSYKETSRLDSILTLTGLNNRFVESEDFSKLKDPIDYISVNESLEDRRKISKEFLINALKKVGEKNELL